jgi:hypothetical protein
VVGRQWVKDSQHFAAALRDFKVAACPTRTSFTVSLRVMGDQANYINFFFHSACHRPAAALGLADPDVVQHAGRRSRASRGTVDPARRAGPKIPDEERKGIQAGAAGVWRRLSGS